MGGSYVPPSSRRANMMADKEGGSTSPSSLPPASPAADSDVSGSPPNEGKGARGYQGGGGGNRGKGGGKGKGKGKRGDEDVRSSWGNTATDEASYEHLFRNTRHQAGLHFDKYKEIPVDVTSSDPCPVPLDTFDNSGLHQLLLDNVERYKYRVPTPVQRYSVPIMMTGKDVMACAQTGSGKTAAFLFPIIHILLAAGPRPFRKRLKWGQVAPESLVLAPTRELAMQIFEESQKFCYKTGLRSVSVYGGMDMRGQVQELDKGCQILVATPGRLIDLCTPRQRGDSQSTNHPKISLSNIYVFCIDEADRMLDMGFEMQMRQIVQKLEMPPKSEIQTMMFSATFPAPIQRLAADFLSEPFFFIKVGQIGSTNLQITQNLEYCSEARKPEFLVALLRHHTAGPKKLVLVFVDTKHSANELVNRLQSEGFNAATIHGDRVCRVHTRDVHKDITHTHTHTHLHRPNKSASTPWWPSSVVRSPSSWQRTLRAEAWTSPTSRTWCSTTLPATWTTTPTVLVVPAVRATPVSPPPSSTRYVPTPITHTHTLAHSSPRAEEPWHRQVPSLVPAAARPGRAAEAVGHRHVCAHPEHQGRQGWEGRQGRQGRQGLRCRRRRPHRVAEADAGDAAGQRRAAVDVQRR